MLTMTAADREAELAPADQYVGCHRSFALDLNYPSGLKPIAAAQTLVRAVGYLNVASDTVRFHTARSVDCVAPQVVAEFLLPDDAGHHRSGVDAYAKLKRLAVGVLMVDHLVAHGECEVSHCLGVVGPRFGEPPGHHVGVADRLYLLEAVMPREFVEG
jgi:hypothetical protein